MSAKWQKFLVKTIVWFAAEVWLNLLGLDELADYSEFIFEQNCFSVVVLDSGT